MSNKEMLETIYALATLLDERNKKNFDHLEEIRFGDFFFPKTTIADSIEFDRRRCNSPVALSVALHKIAAQLRRDIKKEEATKAKTQG